MKFFSCAVFLLMLSGPIFSQSAEEESSEDRAVREYHEEFERALVAQEGRTEAWPTVVHYYRLVLWFSSGGDAESRSVYAITFSYFGIFLADQSVRDWYFPAIHGVLTLVVLATYFFFFRLTLKTDRAWGITFLVTNFVIWILPFLVIGSFVGNGAGGVRFYVFGGLLLVATVVNLIAGMVFLVQYWKATWRIFTIWLVCLILQLASFLVAPQWAFPLASEEFGTDFKNPSGESSP